MAVGEYHLCYNEYQYFNILLREFKYNHIIYKNKYYTLSVLRYLWYDSNNQLPSSIKCRVYVETKKLKKKE